MIETRQNGSRLEYHDNGDCYIKPDWGTDNETTLLHGESCILIGSEISRRECNLHGPIEISDELWALYIMLDGKHLPWRVTYDHT
jgi:hypothetical protein